MAISATVTQTTGLGGGLKISRGTFTSTAGSSGGTHTLMGGTVWNAHYQAQGANDDWETIPYTWSSTNSVITITVAARGTVGTGRFIVLHS